MKFLLNNSLPPLPDQEITQLILNYQATKCGKVLNTIVKHNLRLVGFVAKDYKSDEDLLSQGCLGLTIAINKFDISKNTKFSTYAIYWIKAYMLYHIMNSARLVKVGTNQKQRKMFFQLNKLQTRLEAQGVEITPEVLAQHLEVTEADVLEHQSRMRHEHRLDSPMSDENSVSRLDLLTSEAETPEEALSSAEYRDFIHQKLGIFRQSLNAKEQLILDHRLCTEQEWTLQEIGDKVGISRERIRQIQAKLEPKLREFWLAQVQ